MSNPSVSANSGARLDPVVYPKHYDVSYSRIDLEQHVFEGTVRLQCTTKDTVPTSATT